MAFAWAPNKTKGLLSKILGSGNKSSIRGGFGIVYDRFGQGIVDDANGFNANSSGLPTFGLTTALGNSPFPINQIPRLTSVNVIPPALCQPVPRPRASRRLSRPCSSSGGTSFGDALDTSLKTPYSYTIDFSVQRDLGRGFSLDVAYVGRLSHRLLSSQDVAQPLDLRDKKSGLDYYSAIQPLAKLYNFRNHD